MRYQRPPHLTVRAGVHYFRMSVPVHVRERVGQREFKISLKTRDPLRARESCRRLSNYFERVVNIVASNPRLSRADIDRMVKGYFEELVEEANLLRFSARVHIPGFDVPAEIDDARNEMEALRAEMMSVPSERTKRTARTLWEENTKLPAMAHSEEFEYLCDGVLRAQREAARLLAILLEGKLEEAEIKDPLLHGVDPLRTPPLEDDNPSSGAAVDEGVFSALVDLYSGQMTTSGRWAISAQQENLRALNWFALEFGHDRKINSISQPDVREFRDVLMRLPANFIKQKKYSGMKPSEIANVYEGAPLAHKTQVKMFTAVKAFFQWCVNEGYLSESPVGGLTMMAKKTKAKPRRAFSSEELVKLFHSPMYVGCAGRKRRATPGAHVFRDGMFWLPLVGLFSGMRIAEIIQLPVSQVREQDGINYFDLTGIKLKTENSQRQVPVHPELKRLGLLEFVESQAKEHGPSARVFEDFTLGSEKDPGGPASKMILRYLRSVVTEDRGVVFHSFRHSFSDALRRTDIQDSRRRRLMGHAGEGATDTDYDSTLPAVYLAEDMAKINYPVDLSHLYVSDAAK